MPDIKGRRPEPLLGVCGLYCGACYHRLAGRPGGEHLLAEATRRSRPREGYTCDGCRSGRLYRHAGCAACALRACADACGLAHCGECGDAPCSALRAFWEDGRPHHADAARQLPRLVALGPARWLEEQRLRWTCACGAPYSWYETTCSRCGAPLDSFGPDPTLPPGATGAP